MEIQAILIIFINFFAGGQGQADLTLQSNPGLHTFSYYGAFADDISFGKLIVTIDTKRIMKAVLKAGATMDHKINSTSPFLKLMGRRVLESVNPATERLNTLDAILYQARQSKRDIMGLAAMGVASYAIYDIQQLRGELGGVLHQQHAIEATLRSAAREVEDLHLAAAQTKAALQSVLHNVTDMEQLVQVQILAQNIIEFANAMTAGLEAVLDNKLSPSLVPENLLRQDFRAFREHAGTQGLTPVIQDHKQVYQLTAFFTAERGQKLQVYVRVPLKPVQNLSLIHI